MIKRCAAAIAEAYACRQAKALCTKAIHNQRSMYCIEARTLDTYAGAYLDTYDFVMIAGSVMLLLLSSALR